SRRRSSLMWLSPLTDPSRGPICTWKMAAWPERCVLPLSGSLTDRKPTGSRAMMRITVRDDTDYSLLEVEGRLIGPWVAELDRCWRQTRTCRPFAHVRLDLNEATH